MRRSPQNAHNRSRKDLQQKQSLVVRYSEAIAAKCSRQKPQGLAAKEIVSCSLQWGDHRKMLTTEAARTCSKRNPSLFVTVRRSPQNVHNRSRKDLQQKKSLVVRYSEAITAKCSQQKPQGLAAKAIVSCSLQWGDHRKMLTTEAARACSKSNRSLFVTVRRSPQNVHNRSRKDLQQKQSLVVPYSEAITAKCSQQKPQGLAAKAIVNCSLQWGDHRKFSRQKPQGLAAKEIVRCSLSEAITAKRSQQKPQGLAAKAIVGCSLQWGDHRKMLTTEAARACSKSNC